MSRGIKVLHSHSDLERTLILPKDRVIIDYEYKELFGEHYIEEFIYNGVLYLIVPTRLFVARGGVFKNLKE